MKWSRRDWSSAPLISGYAAGAPSALHLTRWTEASALSYMLIFRRDRMGNCWLNTLPQVAAYGPLSQLL
jgi:hypothetical protein